MAEGRSMTSRHLIDPEIAPLLEILPPLQLSDETIASTRKIFSTPNPDLPPPLIEPRQRWAPGASGPEVPLLVFDPPNRKNRAAILQLHGGGVVLGTAASSTLSNAALAAELDVLVVAVDYRLAPENPFPAAQNDCLAAYDWLVANAAELRVDAGRIVWFGESAGGYLAASLALMARDLGRPQPRAQVLIYPMLDCHTGGEAQPGSVHTGEFIWTRESNRYSWAALRGDYSCNDHRTAWFSPALATDLSNLPPTFIATGALDLFLEEDLEYARRLVLAGVPVELHVYPGCVHAFNLIPTARVCKQYDRDLKAAISKALGL
jgi:triacylglycerol lipase